MKEAKSVQDLFSVAGHVALITGGSKGLGRAMALALAQAGATTVICSRSKTECEQVAAEIAGQTNQKSIGLALNVINEEEVDGTFAEVVKRFGKLDIVINSAGINVRGAIEELSQQDFRNVIETNLNGTWLCCRAAARIMKPRRYGSVINLGSALSKVALPGRTAYCASKFGVIGLTQALALEWAESGVRCNAICPGPFLTEMNRPIKEDPARERQVVGQTALNRWGEMHEITGAALYLASPASTYVTGSSLSVDAGWTAR